MKTYERIFQINNISNSACQNKTRIRTTSPDEEAHLADMFNVFSLEHVELDFFQTPGMEEEQTPFDDVADMPDGPTDDSGSDDPFGEGGDDPFGDSSSDDPFGSSADDPFGEDDSEGGKSKKSAPKKLNRKELLNQKFDMSKIIRKDFPTMILKLKTVTINAISIIEKKAVRKDLEEDKRAIIERYRNTLSKIEKYLTNIANETYEDIFTTYVSFWSILNSLKKAANNLV